MNEELLKLLIIELRKMNELKALELAKNITSGTGRETIKDIMKRKEL